MGKHSVQSIALDIVRREGGYVNDPDDPGGATKYGVTIHTMRRLGIDMDRDGDVDVQDVKLLTVEKAVEIFTRHYFRTPRIDKLPECLQDTVFDMYVNAGANAVRLLQRLCNKIPATGSGLKADGVIGPRTLAKIRRVHERLGDAPLRNAYGIERREFYLGLAEHRPRMRKYARTRNGEKGGWIRRAEEFIDPKYHMSASDFAARTKRWQ